MGNGPKVRPLDPSTPDQNAPPDPFGLGEFGKNHILGSSYFVYGPGQNRPTSAFPTYGGGVTLPHDLDANHTIRAFLHMTGPQLAQIQLQLYRSGGFYPATFVPTYGTLRTEDINAFTQFMVGVASNPAHEDMGSTLERLARAGDAMGVNQSARTRAPLVVKLTNPDDLRMTFQNVAQELYGGNLPDEDVNRLVATFQSQEQQYQSQAYEAGAPELTASYEGPGGVVVKAPEVATAAETQIRAEHPNEVFANALNNRLNTLGNALLGGMIPSGMR